MNKALRVTVIVAACYLAGRAILAGESLSDVADGVASSPQAAMAALAAAVITAWGLVRLLRSRNKAE